MRHVVEGTMKCDVSQSPSEPTHAPVQPAAPSFETSPHRGGPSDGVTVTLRDGTLHCKTLSEDALAARVDRRLHVWPCADEPATDLTEFENYVSTRCKTTGTAKSYLHGLRSWFASFHVKPASGLATTAMALQLWDPSVSWSGNRVL